MKKISFSSTKAEELRNNQTRNRVSFEDCILAVQEGRLLDDIPNPSSAFPHQRIFIFEFGGYAYAAPYVQDDDGIFLKTIYPSRLYNLIYLKDKDHE